MIATRETIIAPRYFFRSIHSASDLEEALRLRYRVYRQSVLRKFCPYSDTEIDFDAYDLRSHHIGLFEDASAGGRVKGYVRVVTQGRSPQLGIFRELFEHRNHDISHVENVPLEKEFPLMSYFPSVRPLTAFCAEAERRHETVVEGSRLSLTEDLRCLAFGNFMKLATIAYCYARGYDHAFVCCRRSHGRAWMLVGGSMMPDTKEETIYGTRVICLLLSRANIRRKPLIVVRQMADELSSHDKITFVSSMEDATINAQSTHRQMAA